MRLVDGLARRTGEIATATRLAVRGFGLADSNPVPRHWSHITKIDPEDEKKLPLLYPLYLRHTSAISIGGSQDVTNRNTLETFELLQRANVPLFHEPSAPHHITERTWELSRFTAIPEVLNGDSTSLVGKLGVAIDNIRSSVVPDLIDRRARWLPHRLREPLVDVVTGWLMERAVFEAYIIQNVESAAAETANVGRDDNLTPTEAAQHALAAEKHLDSEIIYLEYSGRFGGDEATATLEAIADAVSWPRIWYGGGLYERAQSEAVLDAGADAVIVGNVFHEVADEERALCAEASEALDAGPSSTAVRTWVEDTTAVAETNATRYLSTIPDVPDPVGTATEYLAATVETWLALESLVDDVGDVEPTAETLQRAVDECEANGGLPGESVLNDVLGTGGRDLAREFSLYHLGQRFGATAGTLPLAHLGPF